MDGTVVKLAPSILSADFARLGDQVAEAEQAGWALRAESLHGRGDRPVAGGVAINPATSPAVLEEIVHDLDQVLVMTVNPGFGHQRFLPTTLPKIGRVREPIERLKPGCDVEVDGGHRRDDSAAGRSGRRHRAGGGLGDLRCP